MHLTNWLRAPGTEELEHVFPTRLKSWLHNILIISHFSSSKTGFVEYFGSQLEIYARACTFAFKFIDLQFYQIKISPHKNIFLHKRCLHICDYYEVCR